MSRKIIFRVDGGNIYGVAMGHVFKCLRLAYELKRRDVDLLFIMKNYPEGVNLVKSSGFHVEVLDRNVKPLEEAKEIVCLAKELNAIIYIDLRDGKKHIIDLANQEKLITVVYEDVSTEFIEPTLLINPSLTAHDEKRYCSLKTCYLLGIDYMVIAPEISNYKRTSYSPVIRNLFICFGGADPCNISSRVLNVLLSNNYNSFRILIALGPAFKYLQDIKTILLNKDKKRRVQLIQNCTNLVYLQSQCEAAITSGGTLVYEMIALSIPTLVLPSIDTEVKNISPLIERGFVKGIKREVSLINNDEMGDIIEDFLKDIEERQRLYNNSTTLASILTDGIFNVVGQIESILAEDYLG